MGASQQARHRLRETVTASADVCGFSYLSGKAPAVIVTALGTASALDKDGMEGSGMGKLTGLRRAPSVSTLFTHCCVRLTDTTRINLESEIK